MHEKAVRIGLNRWYCTCSRRIRMRRVLISLTAPKTLS